VNYKIKNSHTFKPSSIKRAWVPTTENRALKHLLNLILEPLVEMTSEFNSFRLKLYKPAKQAIAYLRSQLKTQNEETSNPVLLNLLLKMNYTNLYQKVKLS
jgi:retron-type reverse transcriptase